MQSLGGISALFCLFETKNYARIFNNSQITKTITIFIEKANILPFRPKKVCLKITPKGWLQRLLIYSSLTLQVGGPVDFEAECHDFGSQGAAPE